MTHWAESHKPAAGVPTHLMLACLMWAAVGAALVGFGIITNALREYGFQRRILQWRWHPVIIGASHKGGIHGLEGAFEYTAFNTIA